MQCDTCPSFDKENRICDCEPSLLDNPVCLMRNICWLLNILIQDNRDIEEEGEDWKNGGQE